MPTEPARTTWSLPDPSTAQAGDELVGIGADLAPGTLLAAYRRGLFPMPLSDEIAKEIGDPGAVGWWSPDPRAILPIEGLHKSRSLRRSMRRYEVSIDTSFVEVVRACADPTRPHGWINEQIVDAYAELHRLGWAHSVEVWDVVDGTLAGGLYGVAIGGLFAGESKFHHKTDASKVALVALVTQLHDKGYTLLDAQWLTGHLATLGAATISRNEYLDRLSAAIDLVIEPLAPLDQRRRFD